MNALVDPPFAKDPPVKINVNAKTLGLVLLILGAIGILLQVIGLFTIFGFCSAYFGCHFPILWLLGDIVGLGGTVLGTIGAYRMYEENPQGKEWVIYGLALGLVGAVLTLVGNLSAYSGLLVGAGAGAIFGLIIDLIVYFIVYYLVVVSRFPSQAPLNPPGASSWGGPSAPPPPPL
jgi:hypothetical protein